MRCHCWRFALSDLLVHCSATGNPRPDCHFSICAGLYLERISTGLVPLKCKFANVTVGDCCSKCHSRPAVVEYVRIDPDHDCSCYCDCDCPGTIYHSWSADWCGQRLILHRAIDSIPQV